MTDPDGRYARGLAARREVLGDEHVDRSLGEATEFSAPAQELVTEYCWGEVWSRPGLDRRVRSLINLAMLTALNRRHEFRVHVRGAFSYGDDVTCFLRSSASLPSSFSTARAAW